MIPAWLQVRLQLLHPKSLPGPSVGNTSGTMFGAGVAVAAAAQSDVTSRLQAQNKILWSALKGRPLPSTGSLVGRNDENAFTWPSFRNELKSTQDPEERPNHTLPTQTHELCQAGAAAVMVAIEPNLAISHVNRCEELVIPMTWHLVGGVGRAGLTFRAGIPWVWASDLCLRA